MDLQSHTVRSTDHALERRSRVFVISGGDKPCDEEPVLSRRGCQGGVSEIGRGVDSVDDHDVHTALVAHVGESAGKVDPPEVHWPRSLRSLTSLPTATASSSSCVLVSPRSPHAHETECCDVALARGRCYTNGSPIPHSVASHSHSSRSLWPSLPLDIVTGCLRSAGCRDWSLAQRSMRTHRRNTPSAHQRDLPRPPPHSARPFATTSKRSTMWRHGTCA